MSRIQKKIRHKINLLKNSNRARRAKYLSDKIKILQLELEFSSWNSPSDKRKVYIKAEVE